MYQGTEHTEGHVQIELVSKGISPRKIKPVEVVCGEITMVRGKLMPQNPDIFVLRSVYQSPAEHVVGFDLAPEGEFFYKLFPSLSEEGFNRPIIRPYSVKYRRGFAAKQIQDIYVGLPAIIGELESDATLSSHLSWIRSLSKPYSLPPFQTISFI